MSLKYDKILDKVRDDILTEIRGPVVPGDIFSWTGSPENKLKIILGLTESDLSGITGGNVQVQINSLSSGLASHTHVVADVLDLDVMAGASQFSPGLTGLVPEPQAGDQNLFLGGDGQWKNPSITLSAIIAPGTSAIIDTVEDFNAMKWVTTTSTSGLINTGAFETLAVPTDCTNYAYIGDSLDIDTDVSGSAGNFQLIFTNNEISSIIVYATRVI